MINATTDLTQPTFKKQKVKTAKKEAWTQLAFYSLLVFTGTTEHEKQNQHLNNILFDTGSETNKHWHKTSNIANQL